MRADTDFKRCLSLVSSEGQRRYRTMSVMNGNCEASSDTKMSSFVQKALLLGRTERRW
jgi:hypothetical protein